MILYDTLDEAMKVLVPSSGPADTNRGEIVRAFQRLEYRWYNDGDEPGDGYGNETCNSSARYLVDVAPTKYAMFLPFSFCYRRPTYTQNPRNSDFWEVFRETILDWINDTEMEDWLMAKNEHDSRGDEYIEHCDYSYTEDEDDEDVDDYDEELGYWKGLRL